MGARKYLQTEEHNLKRKVDLLFRLKLVGIKKKLSRPITWVGLAFQWAVLRCAWAVVRYMCIAIGTPYVQRQFMQQQKDNDVGYLFFNEDSWNLFGQKSPWEEFKESPPIITDDLCVLTFPDGYGLD